MGNLPLAIAVVIGMTLVGTTRDAAAQPLELGASIAVSCKGSDGSFCNDSHSGLRTTGVYASVWVQDRIEVSGRMLWLNQPDLHGLIYLEEPFDFSITDRRRTIAQGEVVWHFRNGKRVRPMFGIGVGRYFDRETVSCQPPGCEPRLLVSGLGAGEVSESHSDQSLVVGVSVLLKPRWRLRGGWRYHNPFRDELALSEVFLAAGYTIGGR